MKLGQKIVMEHSGDETETERRLRAVYKKSFRRGRGALAYAFDLCFALLTAAFALYICIRPHFESRAAARLVTGICLALLAVIWKAAENELFIRHIKRLRGRKKEQISKARLTVRMYERFLSREEGPGVYVSRSVESLSADEVITALKTRSLPVTVISCAEPTEKAAELINALGNEVRFKKLTPPESAWQCEEVTESDTDAALIMEHSSKKLVGIKGILKLPRGRAFTYFSIAAGLFALSFITRYALYYRLTASISAGIGGLIFLWESAKKERQRPPQS